MESMIRSELIRSFMAKHRKQLLIVSLCGGVLAFFLTVIFPAMELRSAELISSSWPPLMKNMFGDPIYGFTDIYGWIQLQIFHITLWALFGVFAALLASNIIAKEFETKTIDIILACPISRAELILSRLAGLTVLVAVAIVPVVIGCCAGITALSYQIRFSALLLSALNGFLLCLFFAGTTLLLSVFIHAQTLSVVLSFAAGGFFFLLNQMIVPLFPALGRIAFLNPFSYYNSAGILIHGTCSPGDPFILLLFFISLSGISVSLFRRRDILY
jgi:ABC-2 type transport system permease protein